VADVLTSGPERARPPRRRWPTAVAGVVLALGAAYLAGHAGGAGPAAAPPTVRIRPAPDPAPSGPSATYRLDGDPGPGPAGVKVLVGGYRPGILDARTGGLTPLRVPATPGSLAEVDRSGGVVTVMLQTTRRLRADAVAIGRDGRVTPLGQVLDLLPLRDGTVLTEDCDSQAGSGPCRLTGRTAQGATRWQRVVPRQVDLIRDTPYGLLVRADQGGLGGVLRLEDARTGSRPHVLGRTYAVLGADDRQVVFLPAACGSDCDLTLTDLASGASRFLPQSPGNPTVAAFSADGRRLAIGYAGLGSESPDASPTRDGYVAVLDASEPEWSDVRTVPGVATGVNSTALPVWAPDGRLILVVPTDGSGSGRAVVWRPGDARVTVLPVGLTGFYGTPGLAALVS
jgi:hypothetical protein